MCIAAACIMHVTVRLYRFYISTCAINGDWEFVIEIANCRVCIGHLIASPCPPGTLMCVQYTVYLCLGSSTHRHRNKTYEAFDVWHVMAYSAVQSDGHFCWTDTYSYVFQYQ